MVAYAANLGNPTFVELPVLVKDAWDGEAFGACTESHG